MQLLPEDGLEGLAVLCELLDTFMELVKRHLVLEESPTELWLVIDVRDLGHLVGRCDFFQRGQDGIQAMVHEHLELLTCFSTEFLGNLRSIVLQLLEKAGRDGEEVNAGKGFNFACLKAPSESGVTVNH